MTAASPTPCTSLSRSAGRVDHLDERAETVQQPLGDGLGVAAWDGAEEQQLEQLVVRQRFRTAVDEALLEPLAVSRVRHLIVLEERTLLAVRGLGAAILQSTGHRAPPESPNQADW